MDLHVNHDTRRPNVQLLFVHDGEKMKEDTEGSFYTDGSYNHDVWDRYLNIFGNVRVIFRKDPNVYEPSYAKSKFQFFDKEKVHFTPLPDLKSSIQSFVSVRKRAHIRSIIREEVMKCDYLIVRLPGHAGNIAIHYAKKYNKPYLVEVVGCPWDSLWNHSYKGKILAPLAMYTMRKSVREAPFVIYVTNDFLQKRYPTRGKNIGCSDVILSEFDENIMTRRINKILHHQNEKLIIGTTAAIDVRYKGQQYIIMALGLLKKKGFANIEYQLVGGGDCSYLRSIAEQEDVEEQVKFLGTLQHKQVFEWLDHLDIYTQPSRQEGLPRALVEAMSRGLPAFGARTGGIPECLEDKYLFSNSRNNIEEICRIILSYTKDSMCEQAKRNYKESQKYDKQLIGAKRTDFLRSFLEYGTSFMN